MARRILKMAEVPCSGREQIELENEMRLARHIRDCSKCLGQLKTKARELARTKKLPKSVEKHFTAVKKRILEQNFQKSSNKRP